MNSTSIGVVVIGHINQAAHLEAIEQTEGLYLTGVAGAPEPRHPPLQSRSFSTGEEAAADAESPIVALCTPPQTTRYLAEIASNAGKTVVAEMPVASSYRETRDLVSHCTAAGVPIAGVTDLLYSSTGRRAAQAVAESIGPPLYVECHISVPRAKGEGGSGVLASAGVMNPQIRFGEDLMSRGEMFGTVDRIYARSRALVASRPAEDVAVAQIQFYDGVEGLFSVNGLGDDERIDLHLHGACGSVRFKESRSRFPDGLRAQYRELAANPSHGAAEVWANRIKGTQLLLDWINHAARQGCELSRKEVSRAIGG